MAPKWTNPRVIGQKRSCVECIHSAKYSISKEPFSAAEVLEIRFARLLPDSYATKFILTFLNNSISKLQIRMKFEKDLDYKPNNKPRNLGDTSDEGL